MLGKWEVQKGQITIRVPRGLSATANQSSSEFLCGVQCWRWNTMLLIISVLSTLRQIIQSNPINPSFHIFPNLIRSPVHLPHPISCICITCFTFLEFHFTVKHSIAAPPFITPSSSSTLVFHYMLITVLTFASRPWWMFFTTRSISRSFGPTRGLMGPSKWPMWSSPT